MKKRGLVYPYNRQFTPFLRHGNLRGMFDKLTLISPDGFGMNGKDASRADGGTIIGLTVKGDFESELDDCDVVIFSDYCDILDYKKDIRLKVDQCIYKKKDIICLTQLESSLEVELNAVCLEGGIKFTYYGTVHNDIYEVSSRLESISVPVIFVLGAGERTNKLDVQLVLRNYFVESGYKVSQIGSRQCCECFGFHSFPTFMFDCSVQEKEKVFQLNHYVKRIEEKEKPDVFIIGVPGGVMPINHIFVQDFGILAYEVSCAITPDFVIMSLFYEQYEKEFIESFNNSIKYKFGFDIDCFNMANTRFDWPRSFEKGKLSYLSVSLQNVQKQKDCITVANRPVFSILDSRDALSLCQFTKSKLEGYSEVAVVNEM